MKKKLIIVASYFITFSCSASDQYKENSDLASKRQSKYFSQSDAEIEDPNNLLADRAKLEVFNNTAFETGRGRTLKIIWTGDVHQPPQEDIIGNGESSTRESKGIGAGGKMLNFRLEVYREKDGNFLPSGSISIGVWSGYPGVPGRSFASFKTYIAVTGHLVLSCEYSLDREGNVRETDVTLFSRDDW